MAERADEEAPIGGTVRLRYSAVNQDEEAQPPPTNTRRAAWTLGGLVALAVVAMGGLVYGVINSKDGLLARIHLHHNSALPVAQSQCASSPNYPHSTLKLVQEASMFALFGAQSGTLDRYEASDVIAKGDYYYIICDSSWSIYKVHRDLPTFSRTRNAVIRHVHKDDLAVQNHNEESSYEAIWYDEKEEIFYLVREAFLHAGGDKFHSIIEEVRLEGDEGPGHVKGVAGVSNNTIVEACMTEDLFTGDSKGFEGVVGMRSEDGVLYLLALCEGNHCEQDVTERGFDRGNGVILVLRKDRDEAGTCTWVTVRRLSLPSSVYLMDYSAIDYNPQTNLFAITSQEDSKLWVGPLINPGNSSFFDPEESVLGDGTLFDFPRNDACEKVYCNVEGVHWITDNMVVAVSDQMKDMSRQDFRCLTKDESVHVFYVPLPNAHPDDGGPTA